MYQLANKNEEPDYTPKSEIFSLGMLALELCMLSSPNKQNIILKNGLDDYYNYEDYTINLKGVR